MSSFSNNKQPVRGIGFMNSFNESNLDENVQMGLARKESGFDIASEALRLIDDGSINDPDLQRLCLSVFPELAFRADVKAIIDKSKII